MARYSIREFVERTAKRSLISDAHMERLKLAVNEAMNEPEHRHSRGIPELRAAIAAELDTAWALRIDTLTAVMLVVVTRELDHKTRMAILYTTLIIFAFRAGASPTIVMPLVFGGAPLTEAELRIVLAADDVRRPELDHALAVLRPAGLRRQHLQARPAQSRVEVDELGREELDPDPRREQPKDRASASNGCRGGVRRGERGACGRLLRPERADGRVLLVGERKQLVELEVRYLVAVAGTEMGSSPAQITDGSFDVVRLSDDLATAVGEPRLPQDRTVLMIVVQHEDANLRSYAARYMERYVSSTCCASATGSRVDGGFPVCLTQKL